MFSQAAYHLTAAACKAGSTARTVPPEEQRLWLGLAARALYLSDAPTGRGAAPAAQLAMRLEDFAFAWTVLAKSGAFITCTSVFNTAT